MPSEALLEGVSIEHATTRRPAIRNAGLVLAAAGALGLIGQLLFFDVGLGINFPIAIGLLLAGGWMLRRRPTPLDLRDVWLSPVALTFAAFAALRADPAIVALDVMTSLALSGGALASFGGRALVTRSLGGVIGLGFGAVGWAMGGAVAALADVRRAMPSGIAVARRTSPVGPVLRGLAIAIPVVLIFVALFSSADAVFAQMVDGLFGVEIDVGDAAWRIALAAVLAWIAAGGLAFAASTPATEEAQPAGQPAGWRPGTTEIVTVLLAVDAVFGVFVALQGAYLFGGLDTLQSAGLSYAEYARRGFFELVAVAVLAGGLVVIGERFSRDRTRVLVAAAIGLTLLTGVVLISAALRLRLYQEAYGWTELRLYVLATIVLLTIGVIGLLAALAIDRVRWIGHVLIIVAVGIGIVLNLVGPVRFITEQNVARALDPTLVSRNGRTGLDEAYLVSLGDDAIPPLLRALPVLEEPMAEVLRAELLFRLEVLRNNPGLNAWQAWNAGRATARDALQAAESRGDLP